MTMKQFTILLALLVAFLVAPFTASAQTSITTTTLTNAITTTGMGQFDIVVGSATGMTVNSTSLYIDGSVYRIVAISGTTITVINTLRPASHNASVTVWVVPSGAQVGMSAVGSCLRSTAGAYPVYSPYTFMFNLTTGDILRCRAVSNTSSTNIWQRTNPYCEASVSSCSTAPPATR
jgi:hypothetical protein